MPGAGCRNYLEAATGKAADKDNLLGGLTDVNEASTAWGAWREIGDIHISLLIHLLSATALPMLLFCSRNARLDMQ